MRIHRSAFAAVAVLAALLLAGCHETPESKLHPNYREPDINGYVYRLGFDDGSIESNKDFEVVDNQGLRMVPVLELNGSPVEVYSYGATAYRYGDENYNPALVRHELAVHHYWGDAYAHATMPGDFRMTGPGDQYVMGMESTLVITWRRAQAAQWYWMSFWASYDYLDSTGEWDSRDFSLDTLILDTFLVIPPERMFPGFVRQVTEGDAVADLWSGNGPAVEPGDNGNVRGAGYGFFNAVNEPPDKYFYIGAPPVFRRSPTRVAQRHRFLDKLRARTAGPR
jgi:hypothetical protein